jgi:hypothetical protein
MLSGRNTLLLIALSCAGLLVAGCGGESDETSATKVGPLLTKAQFLSKANALCKKNVSEQAAVTQRFIATAQKTGKDVPPHALDTLATEKIFPVAQNMVDELSALRAPKGYQPKVDEVIGEFEKGFRLAEEVPNEYWMGRAFKEADSLADSYGLTNCGV